MRLPVPVFSLEPCCELAGASTALTSSGQPCGVPSAERMQNQTASTGQSGALASRGLLQQLVRQQMPSGHRCTRPRLTGEPNGSGGEQGPDAGIHPAGMVVSDSTRASDRQTARYRPDRNRPGHQKPHADAARSCAEGQRWPLPHCRHSPATTCNNSAACKLPRATITPAECSHLQSHVTRS